MIFTWRLMSLIYSILEPISFWLHNKAVDDLHKTGEVKYTPYNKLLFGLEEIISIPINNIEDRWAIENEKERK